MLESKPNNKKETTDVLTGEILIKLKRSFLGEKLEKERAKADSVYEEYSSLQEDYCSRWDDLRKKFPEEYSINQKLENEQSLAWDNYWDKAKLLGEENEIVQELYKTYREKRDNTSRANQELISLVTENFSEEVAEASKIYYEYQEIYKKWDKMFLEVVAPLQKDFEQVKEDLEIRLFGDGFNNILKFVENYKNKKEKELRTKLLDGLREIDEVTTESLEKGAEMIAKELMSIDAMASQFKKWGMRVTFTLMGVLSLTLIKQKVEDQKRDNYFSENLNKIYDASNTLDLDSATNIILHSIAGDERLPEDWRTFLAKEDSSEFWSDQLRQEYLESNTGEVEEPVTDLESKLNYIALLRMHEKYGKPKAEYGQYDDYKDRASYSAWGNTMHLPTIRGEFKLDDYLAELSHSAQYSTDFSKYSSWHSKDYSKYQNIADQKGVDYDEAQHGMYRDSTTLEFEAHSVIEPKLTKEFEEIKKSIRDSILQTW